MSTLSSVTIDVQGNLTVATGSSALAVGSLTVENGGSALIQRGVTSNNAFSGKSGSTITVQGVTQDWSGYPGVRPDIASGGTLNFDNSAITLGSVNGSGIQGNLNIYNGSVVTTAGNSTTMSGPITVSGAGTKFTDSSQLQSTLTLNDGAIATITTYPTDGTKVVFGTGTNTLILPSDQYAANKLVLANLKEGDKVGVNGQKVSTATMTANNISLKTDSGTTITAKSVTYDSSYTNAPKGDEVVAVDVEDKNGVICYLAGSMIRTPDGDVAIENLRVGDVVLAYANGQSVARDVIWAGRKHMAVQTHLPEADAGYPVRVKANAIADGVPYKDMLITPEHCLFLDGAFVPVRMLVNGGSIAYDHTITAYDYYHVETQQHSIIMADGALTESYLDTGNRGSFRQDGTVVTLGGRHLSWEHDAAAPLETAQPVVEKLFHALAARAGVATGTQALVEDDNLHLVTETGAVVRKLRTQAGRVSFMLPPGVQSVTVVSRSSKPCDVVGPFVNDRRMLGVQIGAVTAISATGTQTSTAHLQADALAGWHGMEAGASARWTNGQATLPLHGLTGAGMTILTLDVVSAGPYLADTPAVQQDVLCA
ncbi:Hint domain-containing protein [Acetobacter indonesiensis]|uniref:Hint domain-containing protein n=1 Tax=Acetobacter indonesiensis TaxID=104101 RepID=UPI0020A5A86A|nr:Hint domain-containing protein [Acetobacter indonesiensis]